MNGTLLIERDAGVVTITLHRPDRKNAMNRELLDDLIEACAEIAGRPHDDRVVVLTGGPDAFCAGADLAGRSTDTHPLYGMKATGQACLAIHRLPQPTIAKVHGAAVGAGFGLAIACDLVVAADDAKFSTMYTDRALSVDFGVSWLLPRLVGLQRAKELVFLPEFFNGEDAVRHGLANRSVPAAELDDHVDHWARRLASAPTLALAQSKRLLSDSTTTDLAAAVEAEAMAQVVNFGTADAEEAVMAFSGGRDPRFQGR